MQLSIIIVNYKSPELILDCLKTVYKETKGISFEVIVVDNDSQDDSRQQIVQKYPEVKWIQMPFNAGFSRANNAGIKIAEGECVLLLNSDTLILENALEKAVAHMNADDKVVAACVQLLNADGSPQNAGNYFVKGGLNVLLTLPVINTIVKKLGALLKVKKPSIESSDAVNYVDWISGAFMLVKKTAIEKAGLMDEDFFLFSEEIEWCSRLRKAGEIAVYTDAKVIHLEGGTTKKLEKKDALKYYEYWTPKGMQLMLSNLLRIRKQYSAFWMLLTFSFYLAEIPVLFIASIFSKQHTFRNAGKYLVNVFSLVKYIPKIISNKPYFYKVM